jgi:DNA-binding SARP family transcriptional activator
VAVLQDRVRCDVLEFEAAIDAGRPGRALELYHGDLLEGFYVSDAHEFERWLEQRRARYQSQASTAAWIVAQRYESESKATLAVEAARRAAQLAPLDERVIRKVLAMLDRFGDRAGAVALYERFRSQLASEFEIEPAPETSELITSIRNRR